MYVCNAIIKQLQSLAEHIRAVHEGVKYPCTQCNYQATSKCNLGRHQRGIHEGVKYPCRKCGQHFSQKGNLARHCISVHNKVNWHFTLLCVLKLDILALVHTTHSHVVPILTFYEIKKLLFSKSVLLFRYSNEQKVTLPKYETFDQKTVIFHNVNYKYDKKSL